jgi:hypothetical protein
MALLQVQRLRSLPPRCCAATSKETGGARDRPRAAVCKEPLMIEALALLMVLSDTTKPTLPRHGDVVPVEERPSGQEHPTDPLFDRDYVATDDPAFMLLAVESARQGIVDARNAQSVLRDARLVDVAERIQRQNEATYQQLEALAKGKGWRLPADNPQRASTLRTAGEARTAANFIVGQIATHQATIAQFRAQLGGKGDAQLKRALRQTLPGYQENLDLLLHLDF